MLGTCTSGYSQSCLLSGRFGAHFGCEGGAGGSLAGVAPVVLGSQDERGDHRRGEGPQNHVNKRDGIRKSNCPLSITDVQAQFCLPAVKK